MTDENRSDAMRPPHPADDEAARAEDVLRLSEAWFAGIASISSDAIVSVDAEQRIVFFNRGAEQIFGYEAAEVLGEPLGILIPAPLRAPHASHVRAFGAGPIEARRMGERGQITGLRKNGEVFPADASISKLEVGGKHVYTAVLRDVTARVRLLESEQEARAAAEAAVRGRDEMLRIVAHDLGNSLAAVRVTTSVLLRTLGKEPEAESRQRIENIRDVAEQMQRLRQDLLDVAMIEAGRLSMERSRLPVRALVAEALERYRPLAAEKSLVLESRIEPDLPPILADEARLQQVLANLLSNAIKFTPAGGRIALGAEAGDDGVRIFVADTGPGIPKASLPRVFDRFWTTKAANPHGAGLGLAIARGIVEAHGGRIWAESEVGQGSTFTVWLPVRDAGTLTPP